MLQLKLCPFYLLIFINIYGPNSDTPNFYASLMDKLIDCLNTQYIKIGGGFNLVKDKDLDSMNYKQARLDAVILRQQYPHGSVCPFI